MTLKKTLEETLKNWPSKKSKRLPYGYMRDTKGGDPSLCVPNPDMIPKIEEAFDYLDKGSSLREVTDWLSDKAGKSISHVGLRNLWEAHRPESPLVKKRQEEAKSLRKMKMTREERKEYIRLRKLQREKQRLTNTRKRIEATEKELKELRGEPDKPKPLQFKELDYSEIEAQKDNFDEPEDVIFRPNPGPQTAFLASEELEVLYGGAAGGGKSYALLADPLRYFDNKNFNGLILRRTNDELRELIWKSHELYPKAYPGAVWREKDKEWRFPSGAKLWFTYLERDEDVRRYQGQAFTYIAFDELTQYPTPFPWEYLRSRLRTTDPTLPVYMRATTNPGGPGHGWVKRLFIDPAPYGTPFWATDYETGETLVYPKGHPKEGQPLFERKFIPAKLSDNPFLFEDGNYEMNLISLPEQQRRQLLEGDWHVADGAAFSEFRYHDHVCKPFDIPPTWRRFRSCDFGYSSHSAVHWFAIDPQYETLYVYRELYASKLTARELARKILEIERKDKVSYGVLDSSCWAVRGQSGPSIAEEMISEGCRWRPSDRTAGSRVSGKNRLHELLKVQTFPDGTERPGIIFFDTCRQIISDLPVIPSDPKGGEDIDDRYASDHAYDSIRYGIMTRPRSKSFFESWEDQSKSYSLYRPSDHVFGY